MDVKIKLMIFIPSLAGGGSERVISILCKYLDKDKFDICLVLLRKEGVFFHNIPKEVNIIVLNIKNARKSLFKIVSIINIHKPDIVFSTLGYLNIIIGIAKFFVSSKIKFFARESSIPSFFIPNEKFPFLFRLLYKITYKRFDKIIAQSEYMKSDLIKNFNIKDTNIVVINNPVDIEDIQNKSTQSIQTGFNIDKINLLAVGRLSKEKGYDLLLQALSKLDDRFSLTILGDGNEFANLNKIILDLNIQNKIRILPFQSNPYIYMKQADFLIMSSLVEGFPNVILEANACGTPVIAFNAPGGTAEIIIERLNGILVEYCNIDALKEHIEKAVDMEFDKDKIINYVQNRFKSKEIVKQYENLFYTLSINKEK